jgi:hypothetical protein
VETSTAACVVVTPRTTRGCHHRTAGGSLSPLGGTPAVFRRTAARPGSTRSMPVAGP